MLGLRVSVVVRVCVWVKRLGLRFGLVLVLVLVLGRGRVSAITDTRRVQACGLVLVLVLVVGLVFGLGLGLGLVFGRRVIASRSHGKYFISHKRTTDRQLYESMSLLTHNQTFVRAHVIS